MSIGPEIEVLLRLTLNPKAAVILISPEVEDISVVPDELSMVVTTAPLVSASPVIPSNDDDILIP
jgi:hypothetical protein